MEIMLNDLLRNVEFLDIDENAKIDSEKNFIIFGSNGLGKTTIYKNLKNKYPDFDYLDYEETKDLFKKNKSKIEISLGINKLEDLLAQKEQIEKDLSIQTFLKPKHITSKKAAKDISVELEKKYAAKEISKIDLEVKEFKEIKKIDRYLGYVLHNFKALQEINDISSELEVVDKNYLRQALSLLDKNMDNDTSICPVCGSHVVNLKQLVHQKIEQLSQIRNECLNRFVEEYGSQLSNESISEEFLTIKNAVKNITEENLVNYFVVDGSVDTIKRINETHIKKDEVSKEINDCLHKQTELFYSLIQQKDMYTDYLQDNFNAAVDFDSIKKVVEIKLERNVDTYSTGEINLILFITKLFSFLGSEKQLLIIDDPISSYDLVNQYHIVHHLCRIITNKGKHVIVFTHNPDVINVVNSQNQSGYSYFFFDKVNNTVIMNPLPKDMKSTGNVLEIDNLIKDTTIEANKYLSLTLKRNDKDPKDTLSSVLHYDNGFVTLGDEANDFKGCSNKFFVDYIELNNYLNDLNTNDFEALCRAKVISLLSIRVWIEYKLATLSAVPLEDTYFKKVDKFFKNNQNVLKGYPNLKRDLLVNKKVMLNQNCHANSQVYPFYYALSVKTDDILKEIKEIRHAFEKNV